MSAQPLPEPETLRLARQYRDLGWSVVPVSPRSKLPAIAWAKYQDSPATQDELHGWFSVGGYGVGLVQGAAAGSIVLDFDGEEGHETRAALEREYGALPHTVEALTPSGGCHVFLQHPGRPVPTRKKVRDGMDVRGDGGFVVACPSIHANTRRYEWDCDHHPEETALAPCPVWVVQMICDELPAGTASDTAIVHTLHAGPLGLAQAVVTDGRETYMRDTVLAVLADLCRTLGHPPTEDELFEAVWPQYSRKVDFTRPGRGATEVRAKCRYTLGRLAKGVLPPFIAAKPAGQTAPKGRPAILHLEDVERLPPPEFLIDGLFPAGGLIVVYGPPKSGKTFLVLSACLHLAANKGWFGHKVRGGCIVYIAGEGVGGLGSRLKAMRSHYQIPSNIPFYVIPRAINFTDPAAAAYLVKLVRDTVGDEPIAAVIVDTLARSMAGADENSAKEVGVVIAACDVVRDELACAVIPIHHQGKDETRGLRGTSAIRGAVDAAFRVTASGKRLTLKNEDQKDAECAPEMVFEMVEVPVGISRKSLVPVLLEGTNNTPAREEKPRGITGFALEILTDTIAGPESAMLPPVDELPSNTRGVAIDVFRREFYARNATRSYEARKKAFGRAVDALVEYRLVAVRDPWIWKVN
jgi:RecA/RadA recombinase